MTSARALRPLPLLAALGALSASSLLAQDSLSFVVLKGADTVAIEVASRVDVTWKGTLTLRRTPLVHMVWSAVTDEKGLTPLVEVTVSEAPTDSRMKPRIVTRNRLIMRGDSVSVDAMTSNGLVTRIFPMTAGAMPYLNLSFAMLDLAVVRSIGQASGAPVSVPFFNLSGGQSATGTLVRKDNGHAALTWGDVTIELALREDGRIMRATISSQDLVAVRVQ